MTYNKKNTVNQPSRSDQEYVTVNGVKKRNIAAYKKRNKNRTSNRTSTRETNSNTVSNDFPNVGQSAPLSDEELIDKYTDAMVSYKDLYDAPREEKERLKKEFHIVRANDPRDMRQKYFTLQKSLLDKDNVTSDDVLYNHPEYREILKWKYNGKIPSQEKMSQDLIQESHNMNGKYKFGAQTDDDAVDRAVQDTYGNPDDIRPSGDHEPAFNRARDDYYRSREG